jgi:hypothetical protein
MDIHGSLNPETDNHTQRNILDEILINKKIISTSCTQAPFPTDHLIVTTTLEIAYNLLPRSRINNTKIPQK